MNRQELSQIVKRLPEEFDPEELIEQLYLKVTLRRAEEAVARGEVVGQDDVCERRRRWSWST
jgi:hypothetical protein